MYEYGSDRNNSNKTIAITITLALFMAVGIIANIFSMVIYKTFYPFLNFMFWLFLPMPILLCGHGFGNDCRDIAYFFTGILAVSGIALPLQLAQFEVIPLIASGLSIGGSTLVYITILIFCKTQLKAGSQDWTEDPFA